MLIGEVTNTNFIILGLTRPMLENYHIRSEHSNHCTTDDAVVPA